MLYNTGTIAINGNTATGTGTNWTAPANQIRAGQTILVLSSPVQVFQISSVDSATSLTVTPAASPALSGQKYAIMVSDIISVDDWLRQCRSSSRNTMRILARGRHSQPRTPTKTSPSRSMAPVYQSRPLGNYCRRGAMELCRLTRAVPAQRRWKTFEQTSVWETAPLGTSEWLQERWPQATIRDSTRLPA